MRRHAPKALILAALTTLLGGCSDSTTSPGVQPEITNLTDDFSYQVTNVRNYSHTDSYPWQNSGTQANVNQSTSVTGGTATLVILDADGTQVYDRSLADNGTYVSSAGTPGAWTLVVTYNDASATVNFRVQKTT